MIRSTITRRSLLKQATRALAVAPALAGLRARAQGGALVLGQSAALSGPAAVLGTQFREGALLALDAVNRQGGVAGSPLRLIGRDDGYDPQRAAQNTRQFIEEDQVLALFGYTGTATTRAALPVFGAAQVPLFAPLTGAESLRNPFNPLIWHVRASYFEEAETLVAQLHLAGISRLGVLYQDDAFGLEGLEGVRRALERRGLSPVALASLPRQGTEVEAAVRTLETAQPGGLLLITTPGSTAAFVRQWRGRSLTHKTVALRAFSVADANQLSQALGPQGEGVGLSQVVPYPYDARRSPVAQAYVDASGRAGRPVTFLGLEGFIAIRALVEVLRTLDGRPTRARLVEALRNPPRLDLGGFPLSFGPKQNTGSSFVEVVALRGPQGFMR